MTNSRQGASKKGQLRLLGRGSALPHTPLPQDAVEHAGLQQQRLQASLRGTRQKLVEQLHHGGALGAARQQALNLRVEGQAGR